MIISNTQSKHQTRRGNLLIGCGVVILIFILLAGIGTYFVMSNWRGWTATGITHTFDTALTEAQLDPVEHAEIMVHVEELMTRFEDKEVSFEDLGRVVEELLESPVIPSALVMGIDKLYLNDSDLEDIEKVQGRIELARFTQGLFDESIDAETLNLVLAPVVTNTPDENDIVLNLNVSPNSSAITALRSADEVTTEDIQTLIANAKAQADESGITETPADVDLSDEIAKAIGIALGDIPDDATEAEIIEDVIEDIQDIDTDTPATDDGP